MKYIKESSFSRNRKKNKQITNSTKITKVIKVTNSDITFDNGIVLSSYHEQDCCEHHYIDFSYVNISDFDGLEFDLSTSSFFKMIPEYGIELVPIKGWSVRIPGYGNNNGYYSTNLSLELSDGRTFDISDCQEMTDD